jgi:hypothetical protein
VTHPPPLSDPWNESDDEDDGGDQLLANSLKRLQEKVPSLRFTKKLKSILKKSEVFFRIFFLIFKKINLEVFKNSEIFQMDQKN